MSKNNIQRLFDIPKYHLDNYPSNKAFNYKEGSTWVSKSIQDFIQDVSIISNALIEIGVQSGDNIAIVTHVNKYDWHVLDMALLQVGAVDVPLYPTLSEKDYGYVLNHSESKYCFASNLELYKKVENIQESTPVNRLFSFEDDVCSDNFSALYELGRNVDHSVEIERRKAQVKSDDLATIVYTSGTTGNPKGAMLSHKNLIFAATDMATDILDLPASSGIKTLSFLPINHIFERTISYFYLSQGYEVYFAESIDKLAENLKEVQPDFIPVVPRLVEKIYDKIIAKGEDLTGIKKKLFFWACDLGYQYDVRKSTQPLGYRLRHKIADKLIFSKWREVFGGKIRYMGCGSAPLQARFVSIFAAAGLKIVEGYGMTESAGLISVNDFRGGKIKAGSVGIPLDTVEVKIASDGEIIVKGDNVFMGYYKDEVKTNETIINGYLHTGDIGVFDSDGFLSITDRKKEMFKTSGGKYIAPAAVENQLKQSPFIEQLVVVGEGKKMPAAIIQVNYEKVAEWAEEQGIVVTDYSNDPHLNTKVQEEVTKYNANLGKWEQVKKFKISPDEWTIDGGQLTPTMKAKRKVIKKQYQHFIDEIYA